MTRNFLQEFKDRLAHPRIGTQKRRWPQVPGWELVDLEEGNTVATYQHEASGQLARFNAQNTVKCRGRGSYSLLAYGRYCHGNWRSERSIANTLKHLADQIPGYHADWVASLPPVEGWTLVAADDTELVYQATVVSQLLEVRLTPLAGDTAGLLTHGGQVEIAVTLYTIGVEATQCAC